MRASRKSFEVSLSIQLRLLLSLVLEPPAPPPDWVLFGPSRTKKPVRLNLLLPEPRKALWEESLEEQKGLSWVEASVLH